MQRKLEYSFFSMIVIYGSGSKSPSVMLYKTNNFPLLKTFLQDEFKTPFLGGTLVSSIHNNHERKVQSNKLSDLVINNWNKNYVVYAPNTNVFAQYMTVFAPKYNCVCPKSNCTCP